ncbi:hypothetical protein LJU45_28780 (plasmid) [Klebsiella pneumoniae]|nr:hypothetical protein LJU45_28780 [Klebsiella pneumoniae]
MSALTAVKHGSYSSLTPSLSPGTHQKIIDYSHEWRWMPATAALWALAFNTIFRHLKNSGRSR